MYPHISREDCYYTDTDSVVLSNPLSEDIIYPSELGKFKLEDKILNGYFLAPKAYCYFQIDGKNVVRFKGPAKNLVNPEWFESQYADLSRTKQVIVESHFRVDWHKFNIIRKETLYTLGLPLGKKRKLVFQGQTWVDTEPIHIIDLSRLDHIGKQVIKSLRIELKQLKIENVILNEKFLMKERELEERYKEMKNTSISMLTTERSLTEERTLFDNMDEAENNPDEKTENQIPNTFNRRRCTTFQDIMDKNVTSETDDEDAVSNSCWSQKRYDHLLSGSPIA